MNNLPTVEEPTPKKDNVIYRPIHISARAVFGLFLILFLLVSSAIALKYLKKIVLNNKNMSSYSGGNIEQESFFDGKIIIGFGSQYSDVDTGRVCSATYYKPQPSITSNTSGIVANASENVQSSKTSKTTTTKTTKSKAKTNNKTAANKTTAGSTSVAYWKTHRYDVADKNSLTAGDVSTTVTFSGIKVEDGDGVKYVIINAEVDNPYGDVFWEVNKPDYIVSQDGLTCTIPVKPNEQLSVTCYTYNQNQERISSLLTLLV